MNQLSLLSQRIPVLIACLKRGIFQPFCTIEKDGIRRTHEKQLKALQILTDFETREFAFGGAAGGAKSFTGAIWLIFSALAYPETRWFVGREELKSLRESTLQTFHKVFKLFGITQYHFHGTDLYFTFPNGSRIDFIEMKYYPTDPYFERFGSKEYTGGWIEEAGEISVAAYDTIKTRLGRQHNDKYALIPKLFITLNPKKNWVHQYFWKPFKDGLLPKTIKFLQSLVTDNPFIESVYIEQLESIADKVRKQRLLYGNFDYDDDDNSLMSHDAIRSLFTNAHAKRGTKYIIVDVARFGKDTTTIYLWDGWVIVKRIVLVKKSIPEVAAEVKDLATKESVPMHNVLADEDGVGGGVVDILGCKGFVNNSSPILEVSMDGVIKEAPKQNYENLKTQCCYMAAVMVNNSEIGFSSEFIQNTSFVDKFTEEAEQVKKRDPDSDGKLKIVQKDVMKELLGRSPDDWDCFMMRQWFCLKKPRQWVEREVSWDEL